MNQHHGLRVTKRAVVAVVYYYRSRQFPPTYPGAIIGLLFTLLAVFFVGAAVVGLRWDLLLAGFISAIVGAALWPDEDGNLGPSDDRDPLP